jgi:OOP family OmpA-OmpF porin
MVALPRLVVWVAGAVLGLHLCPAAAQAQAPAPAPEPPAAEATAPDIGGFVGVRAFSPRNTLGAVTDDGASIASSLALGLRLGIPVSSLVAIEGELPLVPTTAREDEVALLVIEPRVQARVGGGIFGGVEPFAILGLGLPMVISSDRDVIEHDVVAALHAGMGVRIARRTGWDLRVEARTAILPARGIDLAAFDFEVGLGLYRSWGTGQEVRRRPMRLADDRDADGVADEDDRCADRDEDLDGIEDQDGCPDIDDDRDEILDTADRCRLAAETRNGFRDDDGCPDMIPDELTALVGEPGALVFSGGSARVRSSARSALKRLAEVLARHESVRVLIIGHTDDREAGQDAAGQDAAGQDAAGQDAAGQDTAGQDAAGQDAAGQGAAGLSLQRAQAVRDFLVERGVAPQRLEVWGAAAAHPRASNESSRGRGQNRRVTLQILRADIPIRSQVQSALPPAAPPEPRSSR